MFACVCQRIRNRKSSFGSWAARIRWSGAFQHIWGLVRSLPKEVYDLYVKATTTDADRALLDTALKGDAYASTATFKATAADVAKFSAIAKEEAAKTEVDNGLTSTNYSTAVGNLNDAKEALVAAQAADANQTAADAVAAGQKAQEDKVLAAQKAIDDFNTANAGKSTILDQGKITAAAVDTVKDTYYFNHKVAVTDDYSFSSKAFGAGYSIVLDSSLTFNNGVLSTGNNNVAEFFLIQGKDGVQLVIESTVAGSTNATTAADGTVTSTVGATDTTAVINLVGVTLDHVSVANGVVSYV